MIKHESDFEFTKDTPYLAPMGEIWDVYCENFGERWRSYNGITLYVYHGITTECVVYYRKTSNISRTLVGNKIVDNSDVVGASPVGTAPTTSSFST